MQLKLSFLFILTLSLLTSFSQGLEQESGDFNSEQNELIVEDGNVFSQERDLTFKVEMPRQEQLNQVRFHSVKKRSKHGKRIFKPAHSKFAIWSITWLGIAFVVFGLIAPVFFGILAWWSIVLAFGAIAIGVLLILAGGKLGGDFPGIAIKALAKFLAFVSLIGLSLWGIGALLLWWLG